MSKKEVDYFDNEEKERWMKQIHKEKINKEF